MIQRVATVLVVILSAAALAACDGTPPAGRARIDNTGSAAGGSGEICRRDLRQFAQYVADQRGTLWVDLFDDQTASAPTWPIRQPFELPPEIESDRDATENHLARQLDAVDRETARQLVADPPGGSSDYVGALNGAGESFNDAHKGRRLVWLCGDGLDSRLPRGRITMHHVENLLDKVERSGDLPQLKNVEVWMDMALIKARVDLSPGEQRAVEHFHRALVARGGGRVIAAGPGAAP